LFTVDANDAIAAYRVATEALHHARHLRGPSVIEALAVTGGASPLELLTAYMERHGNPPR
jgi:TPP-dependent pyruvate/acetoin dehydrogenase alpha subunit